MNNGDGVTTLRDDCVNHDTKYYMKGICKVAGSRRREKLKEQEKKH